MTDQASDLTSPNAATPDPTLDTIRTLGRLLDDLEKVRIMNSNRIGALERAYGESLPHLAAIGDPLARAEHLAELELVRAWRRHPLAAWAKTRKGVGEKSIARLIAEIGDPLTGSVGHWETSNGHREDETQTARAEDGGHLSYEAHSRHAGDQVTSAAQRPNVAGDQSVNESHPDYVAGDRGTDEPHSANVAGARVWVIDSTYRRTPAQLWQYAGVGDPARARIPKGAVQAELMARGKPRAKKQLWIIATSMLKAGNRDVYDARRAVTSDRVHAKACPQCHAKEGDPWRAGHQHADALRIVAKRFLQDLYDAAAAIDPARPRSSTPQSTSTAQASDETHIPDGLERSLS